jgi:2-oxoglutarate dehydrogenase E2 component (dihydrolipoamide succinyltransferase)
MTIKIIVPEAGESVVEATVGRWLKNEGDYVSAGEALVELETDKVNLEVAAEKAGVLVKIEQPQGQDVQVGDVLGLIDEAAPAPAEKPGEPSAAPAKEAALVPAEPSTPERATPVAKRLAEEQGVDLAQISDGSGQRITREDVESYVQKQAAPAPAASAPPPTSPPSAPAEPLAERVSREAGRPETVERMSRRRQTIAQRLIEAQQTAAMLTTFNEIDLSAVIDLRRRRQESFVQRHDVKLGFMSFFVKASIGALKAFPAINAEIRDRDIIYKHYYDIGIAVGAPEGLVVPVLRDADRLSFAEIERQIKEFGQKAGDNSLSIEELRGGTFTITNGGIFGSLLSTPILNPPQVGILGLHKIEDRPVALKGEVAIRPLMYVALSYDHRLVDGREAVQFLVRIKDMLEDPEELLLEG